MGHEVRRLVRHDAATVEHRAERRPVARRPQRRRPDDDAEQFERNSLEAFHQLCMAVVPGCRRRRRRPAARRASGRKTVDGTVDGLGDVIGITQRLTDDRPAG